METNRQVELISPLYGLIGGWTNIRIVADFFVAFSRFEYALKLSGYVRSAIGGYAEPDWTAFKGDVNNAYATRPFAQAPAHSPLREATDFLLTQPPKRQILRSNGRVGWQALARRRGSESDWLIEIVKCVRNNLFHGGKSFGPGDIPRDVMLIESATTILAEYVALCGEQRGSPRLQDFYQAFREY